MENRFALINTINNEHLYKNRYELYDTYYEEFPLYTNFKLIKGLYGEIKHYSPYIPIHINQTNSIKNTELAILSHTKKDEHINLLKYNELEKQYSNFLDKYLFNKILEKYIDKEKSGGGLLYLNLPDKDSDLNILNLELYDGYDIYITINSDNDIHIKNLTFPKDYTGIIIIRCNTKYYNNIHIENLICPQATIKLMFNPTEELGWAPIQSFVIDNLNCINFYNYDFIRIKIKNYTINNTNTSYCYPSIDSNTNLLDSTSIDIDNLNILTERIVKLFGEINIKNITGNIHNISDGGNNIKYNFFKDKNFVIDDNIIIYNNTLDDIISIIQSLGGSVSLTVNEKTDYLISDQPSNFSEGKKAILYGIKIVNSRDFSQMYKTSI